MPTVRNGAAELAYEAAGRRSAGAPHACGRDRSAQLGAVDRPPRRRATARSPTTVAASATTTYEPEPHDPVADAVAVLDAAGVDRAVVIGASNGGRWSIELALAHPERVAALVLIGAGTRGGPEDDPTDYSAEVQALWHAYEAAEEGDDLDALNRIEAHAWLDGWAAPEGRVPGAVRDLFLAMNAVALASPDPGPERSGRRRGIWSGHHRPHPRAVRRPRRGVPSRQRALRRDDPEHAVRGPRRHRPPAPPGVTPSLPRGHRRVPRPEVHRPRA